MLALLIQDPQKTVNHVVNPAPTPVNDTFGQLPVLASTFDHVDGLFYFTYAVCIFFFVLILGVLLFSVIKYRRRTFDQPPASTLTHNTPLEVVWTVVPLIIVMIMFAWGFKGSLDMTTVPEAAARNTYKATAKQWSWTFTYPDGSQSFEEVWLAKDKPVQFALESTDVLHAFSFPSMRVKRDIIPGRMQTVWFDPKIEGVYHLFCAEYCGDNHSKMYAKVHVVSQAEFAKRPWDVWEDSTPALAAKSGEGLYQRICSTCHSTTGAPLVGPSWKGLFVKQPDGSIVGRQREVIEGGVKKTITVDDAYIIESVRKPAQKVVAEPPYDKGGMSAFDNLEERHIKGLIEFMKSLANKP